MNAQNFFEEEAIEASESDVDDFDDEFMGDGMNAQKRKEEL